MPFKLNRRIELLRPNPPSKDSVGTRRHTFTRHLVFATLMSERGTTSDDNGVEIPISRRRYIVRWNRDYSTAWMARIDGTFYEVKDVADVPSERRRGFMSIVLERSQKTPEVLSRIGIITDTGDFLVTDTGDFLVAAH